MDVNEMEVDVREHGIALDSMKKRVQCNYCEKIVSGFYRLKCHLGGVSKDVLACEKVPNNIKEAFRTKLLEKKRGTLSREVGQLYHPNLPLKRNWSPPHSNGVPNNDDNVNEHVKKVISPSIGKKNSKATVIEDSSSVEVQKCIGRFFYETGINFSAAEAPSFKRMVDAIRKSCDERECSRLIPNYQQLRGTILKDEVKEIQQYVKEVKSSWVNTGCSILLDGWTDGDGRKLINIVVDCPKGPIYLRSLDVSSALANVDSLMQMLDQVIEDVGAENVVQIVTYCTSTCMETVGEQLMEKYKNLFWVVGASHCLEIMLERMGVLDLIRGTMDKAKTITRFIYSCDTVLKLTRSYTKSYDLVKPSTIKSAIPFLTLENIISEQENLKEMFSSSEWESSIWASSVDGKRVTDLILADRSFWSAATIVVKTTIPIVRVISLIYKGDKPLLGFIYETIDQAKETIKEEVKSKRAHYMPFWEIIDDVWNSTLHSPLHSAGYFLNPSLFYASDFYADAEIASGLLCYIVRLAKAKHVQDLVSMQVDAYREAKGSFGKGRSPSRRSSISPDLWWSRYGRDYPELQRLAIRALSQTCDGASKYQLKRSLAEELLTNKGKRNLIEQQRLEDLAFVHYNMQLRRVISTTETEEIDPTSDWVVVTDVIGSNDPSSWMGLIDDNINRDKMTTSTTAAAPSEMKVNVKEGCSTVFPKEESK